MYCQATPWNEFVQLFRATFRMPPPVLSYSALYRWLMTLNSCTASTTCTYPILWPPVSPWVDATSRKYSLEESRLPSTDQSSTGRLTNGRCQVAAPLPLTPEIGSPG